MMNPSDVHLPNVSPQYQSPHRPPHRPISASGKGHWDNAHRDSVPQDGIPPSSPQDGVHSPSSSQNSRRRDHRHRDSQRPGMARPRYWLAGSSIMAGLLLMVDVGGVKQPAAEQSVCQPAVQSEAFLSRDALAKLLSIPERDSKVAVKQALGEPYCVLSPMEVRAGVQADREVYPLAFDENAWVVVLYEGEEYAGYDFKFTHN
ncbi:MAG: hypothetical protein WBA10_17440 [Elainellaceae cyanobacterium]